jgi:hypothetical protein
MTVARRSPLALLRLATVLALAATQAAFAVEPLHQHDVVLLQKGELIEKRVDGGADAMAAYLKTLGAAVTEAMRANPQQIPAAGFIAVAVRPGNQVRTWFDFKPRLSDTTMAALARAAASAPALPVTSGQIVFGLRVSVWSDKPPTAYAPAPQEWKDAAKAAGFKPDIDTLIDMVWPR